MLVSRWIWSVDFYIIWLIHISTNNEHTTWFCFKIPLYYSNVPRFWFKAKFIIYEFEFGIQHLSAYIFYSHFHFTSVLLWQISIVSIHITIDMVFFGSNIWYPISAVFKVFGVFYQFPKKWPNKMDGQIHDTHLFKFLGHGSWLMALPKQKKNFFLFIHFKSWAAKSYRQDKLNGRKSKDMEKSLLSTW